MKKRIAVIENGLLATYTIRAALMQRLIQEGFEVFVVTAPDTMLATVKTININVVDVGSSVQNPIGILKYLLRLYRALKEIKPDVCLTYTIRPAIWGNIVTWVLRIPTITNITGIGPLFESNSLAYRMARFLYKFVLKNPRKIFFQNYDDLKIFIEKKFASPDKVQRIPGSGVDYNHYAPREVKKDTVKFTFLYISRLVKDKGILEYIEAARILKQKNPNVECQVLGPLWLQNMKTLNVSAEELKGWIDEGLINYLGETSDVRDFIAKADCVVLPSYREGTSNVLLEASSMARPCITTDTTGCREIVDDGITGFLCKVRDGEDLAKKMVQMGLVPEPRRREMGKAAREKVIREYDKKIVINAYLQAINEIVHADKNDIKHWPQQKTRNVPV
ncbi:MAG: glycosyltransferase family 4 protein [Chitinophagaceae bacterium]